MSAQLQPQGQPQASAAEGLGLLDDIVARSKVAKTDVEHARAKDIIGELVREVMAGTVTISDNLSASIDARIAEIDRLISTQLSAVMTNLQLGVAGALASAIVILLYELTMEGVTGLTASSK